MFLRSGSARLGFRDSNLVTVDSRNPERHSDPKNIRLRSTSPAVKKGLNPWAFTWGSALFWLVGEPGRRGGSECS
jgi:hypothetical protein